MIFTQYVEPLKGETVYRCGGLPDGVAPWEFRVAERRELYAKPDTEIDVAARFLNFLFGTYGLRRAQDLMADEVANPFNNAACWGNVVPMVARSIAAYSPAGAAPK